MKLRAVLLAVCGFVVCGFSAVPMRASYNCSNISLTLVSDNKTTQGSTILSETITFDVICTNTTTNSQYATQLNTTTGTGGAGGSNSCNPNWSLSYTIPTYVSSGTQDSVAVTAQSVTWGAAVGRCVDTTAQTNTSYCNAQACPSSTGPVGCTSPVILDLDEKGFDLTSAANGVKFDMDGNGPMQMAWTAPGADNAFLALPGADGLVHNGQQLFGNFTPQPASDTPNGFAALAVYDDPKNGGDGNGVIDARDAIFSSLRLWIDANHDGISQPEELHTLPSLGVNSISLNYKAEQRTDQWGNVFHYRAQVNPGDPASVGRLAYDVFFVGLAPTNINTAENKCQAPTNKVGMLAPVSSSLR